MSGPQYVQARAKHAGERAEGGGQRPENSRAFVVLVTVGLLAYGVAHLFIALQLAFTGTSKQTSQKGAFAEMAANSVGDVLLWTTASGFWLWRCGKSSRLRGVTETSNKGHQRTLKRLGSMTKAVIHLAVGVSAVSTTAGLMGTPPRPHPHRGHRGLRGRGPPGVRRRAQGNLTGVNAQHRGVKSAAPSEDADHHSYCQIFVRPCRLIDLKEHAPWE